MGDEDDEIHQVEVALEELQEPEQGDHGEEDANSELVLDEREAAEVLGTRAARAAAKLVIGIANARSPRRSGLRGR